MILRGKPLRFETFSDETMRMIGDAIGAAPAEKCAQVISIATDQNLWEDDVIQKLKELLAAE